MNKMKRNGFLLLLVLVANVCDAQNFRLKTDYLTMQVNEKGYIVSLKDNQTGKEYAPKDNPSPLLNLSKDRAYIHPVLAACNGETVNLKYSNGSEATVKVQSKGGYLRMELLSLSPRNGVDNIVWGPYNTTISKYIGDVFSVVRNEQFAIGIMALNDNTTSGPPCDGEMTSSSYVIHTPDAEKYPVPDSLKEGQRFRIGGDGNNDVAFFSHPEEYYRYMMGNGAKLEPEFGSSIVLHSRDRSVPHTIFYPEFNDFPSIKAPRHLELELVNEDFIGSVIAFYGCPDHLGLKVIEQAVLNEGLPHITRNGKWVKDPTTFCADLAWSGRQDSLVSYARQLNLRAVQDEGAGEYYVNPANRWGGKIVSLGGKNIPISEYTKHTNPEGIDYGLHTLTEFVQPHSSDVSPIPNKGLCTILRTNLIKNISSTDSLICVADTSYLNECGGWDNNRVNALRIGTEMVTYKGVTRQKPYTLTGVVRGAYKTEPTSHLAGEEIGKLQVNCYSGFIPGMELQDEYADFYAKWLIDGGMNYIDFDGFESFTYQGHGQYSFKRFLRRMFDQYHELGGKYLRVMGSCIFEGNWHYMSVCNVGGGNHMFNPVTNEWGIEGKDIRYAHQSSYFPCTFGIQYFSHKWELQTIDNLQSKAIAWDATYMLGLNESEVEKSPQKKEIFKTFRAWEDARAAQVFPEKLKKEMQEKENRYHLEQTGEKTWQLYRVTKEGKKVKYKTLKANTTEQNRK